MAPRAPPTPRTTRNSRGLRRPAEPTSSSVRVDTLGRLPEEVIAPPATPAPTGSLLSALGQRRISPVYTASPLSVLGVQATAPPPSPLTEAQVTAPHPIAPETPRGTAASLPATPVEKKGPKRPLYIRQPEAVYREWLRTRRFVRVPGRERRLWQAAAERRGANLARELYVADKNDRLMRGGCRCKFPPVHDSKELAARATGRVRFYLDEEKKLRVLHVPVDQLGTCQCKRKEFLPGYAGLLNENGKRPAEDSELDLLAENVGQSQGTEFERVIPSPSERAPRQRTAALEQTLKRRSMSYLAQLKSRLQKMGNSFLAFLAGPLSQSSERDHAVVDRRHVDPENNRVVAKRFKRQVCLPARTPEPIVDLKELPYLAWRKDPCEYIGRDLVAKIYEEFAHQMELYKKKAYIFGGTAAEVREQLEDHQDLNLSLWINQLFLEESGGEGVLDEPIDDQEALRTAAKKKYKVGLQSTIQFMESFYTTKEFNRIRERFPSPSTPFFPYQHLSTVDEMSIRNKCQQAAIFLNWFLRTTQPSKELQEAISKIIMDANAIHKRELPLSYIVTPGLENTPQIPGTFPLPFLDEVPLDALSVEHDYDVRYPWSEAKTNPFQTAGELPKSILKKPDLSQESERPRSILKKPKLSQESERPKSILKKAKVSQESSEESSAESARSQQNSPLPQQQSSSPHQESTSAQQVPVPEKKRKLAFGSVSFSAPDHIPFSTQRELDLERRQALTEIRKFLENGLDPSPDQIDSIVQTEAHEFLGLPTPSNWICAEMKGEKHALEFDERLKLRAHAAVYTDLLLELRDHGPRIEQYDMGPGFVFPPYFFSRRNQQPPPPDSNEMDWVIPGPKIDQTTAPEPRRLDLSTSKQPDKKPLTAQERKDAISKFFEDASPAPDSKSPLDEELEIATAKLDEFDINRQIREEFEESLAREIREKEQREIQRKAEEEEKRRQEERRQQELERRRVEEQRLREEEERRRAADARRRKEAAQYAQLTGLRPPARSMITPLTSEWNERVTRASQANPNTDLTTTLDGNPLRRPDFADRLLPPTAWLNDNIIIGSILYIAQYINDTAGVNSKQNPKCAALTSFFWPRLQQHGLNSCARLMRLAGIRKENFLDIDTILVPICQSNHWTLGVVCPSRRTVSHIDSMKAGGSNPAISNRLMEWVKATLGDTFVEGDWKQITYRAPLQTNGWDCGVFTITNAICLALGVDPKEAYSERELTLQRRRLAAVLLNGGFKGDFTLTGM